MATVQWSIAAVVFGAMTGFQPAWAQTYPGKPARIADVMGIPGADEADGGPPKAARYITKTTNPYRLPSMDTNYLINDPVAFRRYHEDALT